MHEVQTNRDLHVTQLIGHLEQVAAKSSKYPGVGRHLVVAGSKYLKSTVALQLIQDPLSWQV